MDCLHGSYPLPHAGSFNCLNWLGGGTGREVKGEDCRGGGGKIKWQLSLRPVVTFGGQAENGESTCSVEWPRIANG